MFQETSTGRVRRIIQRLVFALLAVTLAVNATRSLLNKHLARVGSFENRFGIFVNNTGADVYIASIPSDIGQSERYYKTRAMTVSAGRLGPGDSLPVSLSDQNGDVCLVSRNDSIFDATDCWARHNDDTVLMVGHVQSACPAPRLAAHARIFDNVVACFHRDGIWHAALLALVLVVLLEFLAAHRSVVVSRSNRPRTITGHRTPPMLWASLALAWLALALLLADWQFIVADWQALRTVGRFFV